MKRVLLILSLCLVGGLAATAGAGECHRGRCREACPAVGEDRHHEESSCRGHGRRGAAHPIRKLLAHRPLRRFLFGRACCR